MCKGLPVPRESDNRLMGTAQAGSEELYDRDTNWQKPLPMSIPRLHHDKEFLIKNYSRPGFKKYLHGKQALAIKMAPPERFRDTCPEISAYIPGRQSRDLPLPVPERAGLHPRAKASLPL